ncbi:RHS repeat-associated core domain-containing protein [Microbacterium sp. 13-71-7]|uniref:RHS repeat-associated core domain-containing protein n=1 Tax=Microbacterium sp. 13-71-7 TaxID=1970399 RepID=UPI000BDC980B|nr:RHS repeat-associated core domain-containing protein [Microbacterium sp. 13-71-7]OZB85889.1 MAG: hypothetical protein B7X32_01690 [Microbacterium sp. 13-71-7]
MNFSATFNPANQLTERKTDPSAGLSLDGPASTVVKNTFDKAGNLTVQATDSTRQVNGNSGHTETTTVTAKNTFDYTGRLLTQARDDGQTTAYTYDGLGRTATQALPTGLADDKKNKKNGNGVGPHNTGCGIGGTTPGCPGVGDLTMFGGKTARVFHDGLTPIAWTTSDLSTNLVYGPQGPDHQVTTTGSGTTSSWLYLDRQGTVRTTAGADGATTSASAYTDFGVLEPAVGTLYAGAGTEAAPGQEDKLSVVHLPVTTTRTPVGYTAEQANPVAGLGHYYARDYQPGMAAWLSADPWIGDYTSPGTLNKYVYVLNNPSTLVDVLGNRPCAYEYNNGCHDKPQYIAPPTMPAPYVAEPYVAPVDYSDADGGAATPATDRSNPRGNNDNYGCPPGTRKWDSQYTDGQCIPDDVYDRYAGPSYEEIGGAIAWVWENFGISLSGCLFICFEIGLGGGFTIGIGVGAKADAAISIGGGNAPDGGTIKGVCSGEFGPVGVYGEAGLGFNGQRFGGGGWSGGVGAGCSVMINYRFG